MLARSALLCVVLIVAGSCHLRIPHPVNPAKIQNDSECIKCHVGHGKIAPEVMLDRNKTHCVRCHTSYNSGCMGTGNFCTTCHIVKSVGTYPSLIPHLGGDVSNCSLCHRDGREGAVRTSHVEDTDCYSCHAADQHGKWPPLNPQKVVPPPTPE
jgi:predicted CXXCH cytochrome family protein